MVLPMNPTEGKIGRAVKALPYGCFLLSRDRITCRNNAPSTRDVLLLTLVDFQPKRS